MLAESPVFCKDLFTYINSHEKKPLPQDAMPYAITFNCMEYFFSTN